MSVIDSNNSDEVSKICLDFVYPFVFNYVQFKNGRLNIFRKIENEMIFLKPTEFLRSSKPMIFKNFKWGLMVIEISK